MPIRTSDLRAASSQYREPLQKSITEARARKQRTAFLSHSHLDVDLVKGLIFKLRATGWDVYVDWMDAGMPPIPDRTTAERIRMRIRATDLFFFLATPRAKASRWCPWEIGYADGVKKLEDIIVIPTEENGVTEGAEYLQLYRHLDLSSNQKLAVWSPGITGGVVVESL